MAHQPTELEQRATFLEAEALTFIENAHDVLTTAAAALLEEERKHRAPPPSNQARTIRYVDAANALDRVREEITGRPSIEVIFSKATGKTIIRSGNVVSLETFAD